MLSKCIYLKKYSLLLLLLLLLLLPLYIYARDWDSIIKISNYYELDRPGIESRCREFFTRVKKDPGAQPASCTICALFPYGVKADERCRWPTTPV